MIKALWNGIRKNEKMMRFASKVYVCLMGNKIRGRKQNVIDNQGAFMKKCKIQFQGKNNRIILEKGCCLNRCRIHMSGNGFTLHIGEGTFLENQGFAFEDEGGFIRIGKKGIFSGGLFSVAEKDCGIEIGEACLFSSNVYITTTDSHSICDKKTGERINPGEHVTVGDKVWVGANVSLLKGSVIPANCVVGRGALVTKKIDIEHSVIAGVPAKVVKENIIWKAERI